ncbi:conserved hypothetical protein [Ricinus communis]|uniref:Uncharacterized protein n=1 Tax=Ricinus communis TaxID=3988 RepID=B9SNS4_RICCO|nr:conserved hypothetical protein [Ricinus communis]
MECPLIYLKLGLKSVSQKKKAALTWSKKQGKPWTHSEDVKKKEEEINWHLVGDEFQVWGACEGQLKSPLKKEMERRASTATKTATATAISREDAAKATVAEHISQSVQSTSNLLQLMQQSSSSQALLSLSLSLSLLTALYGIDSLAKL